MQFSCKYCSYQTKWQSLLTDHIQKTHPSIFELLEKDKIVNHSNGTCPKCLKSFVNKYYLPTHIKNCTGTSNPAQCEYCDRVFSSPQARNRHKQHCKVLKEIKKEREQHTSETIPTPDETNIPSTSKDSTSIVVKGETDAITEDKLEARCRDMISELLQPALEAVILKVEEDIMSKVYNVLLVDLRKEIIRTNTEHIVLETKKELIKTLAETLNKT